MKRTDMELILKALNASEPKMSHYPEPIERHQNAINLVRDELRKIHARASKNSVSRATVQTGARGGPIKWQS